jgi:hypothetical protein
MIKKVGKRVVWDGPSRRSVPRGGFTDQTRGRSAGVRVMRRKVAENRYGGSGWDRSRVPHA